MSGQVQLRNAELVDLLRADFINCWIPIAQAVLTETTASVTFADLPDTFRTLVLAWQVRTDREQYEGDGLLLRLNGDSGNNYDYVMGYVYCSATLATECSRATSAIKIGYVEGQISRADNFAPGMTFLAGYKRGDCEKWAFTPNSGRFGDVSEDADMRISFHRGRWRALEAVTSMTLVPEAGSNFAVGTVFELYGIL